MARDHGMSQHVLHVSVIYLGFIIYHEILALNSHYFYMARVLSENAERDDVERFLQESWNRTSQGEKNNIEILTNMINNGGTVDVVSKLTGFSVVEVNSIISGK